MGDLMARFSTDLAAVENAVILAVPETVLGALGVVRAFSLGPAQVGAFRPQLQGFHRSALRFDVLAYLVERTPNLAFLFLQIGVFLSPPSSASTGR